jgi:hypothetical protein
MVDAENHEPRFHVIRHVRARLWDGMNSAEVSGCSQVRPQPFFNSGGDRVHLLPEVVATVVGAFRRGMNVKPCMRITR